MKALTRVARVEARLGPYRWDWAEREAGLVAAHWRRRLAERPHLFNGRVLMVAGTEVAGDVLRARFFETDYAAMLAWIDHDFPGEPIWNGFAMGALRGRDGRYLLARMAAHTANAGRLYFPCGTPDRQDLTASGDVDLAGSLTREIGEETGLAETGYTVDPGWILVADKGLLAFMRIVRLLQDAGEVAARIRRHLAGEARPELVGIEVVERGQPLDIAAMPGVLPIFLADAFARDGTTSGG